MIIVKEVDHGHPYFSFKDQAFQVANMIDNYFNKQKQIVLRELDAADVRFDQKDFLVFNPYNEGMRPWAVEWEDSVENKETGNFELVKRSLIASYELKRMEERPNGAYKFNEGQGLMWD